MAKFKAHLKNKKFKTLFTTLHTWNNENKSERISSLHWNFSCIIRFKSNSNLRRIFKRFGQQHINFTIPLIKEIARNIKIKLQRNTQTYYKTINMVKFKESTFINFYWNTSFQILYFMEEMTQHLRVWSLIFLSNMVLHHVRHLFFIFCLSQALNWDKVKIP